MEKIITDIALPINKNYGVDCGALAVQMLMLTDFQMNDEELQLEKMRTRVNKTKDESTLPGNICKALFELGYEVSYMTKINWGTVAYEPYEKWDTRVRSAIENDKHAEEFSNSIDLEKLRSSAEWLVSKKVTQKKNLTIEELSELLQEGKRIISIVANCTHVIIVTGIDEENVYYNNPSFEPAVEKKTHADFRKYWGSAQGLTEAIIASKM